MTVIAYRDGLLAADSSASGSMIYVGLIQKICRSPDGAIGASSGHSGAAHRFREWMEGGRCEAFLPKAELGDFAALLVFPGRKVHRMDHTGHVFPSPDAAFYAEGCGQNVALGAMAAGASAYEAAMIATQFVPYCLPPCQTERIV